MKIEEVMTSSVDTITSGATITQAAQEMKKIDSGFLPVTDTNQERLVGVTTDRDLVVRCIAEGKNPDSTPVDEAMSEKVLYCFSDDDVESAAKNMAEQQVYRLVVLDDRDSKNLVGVVSLGDLRRRGVNGAAQRAADQIVDQGRTSAP